jgi:hypothetical protein
MEIVQSAVLMSERAWKVSEARFGTFESESVYSYGDRIPGHYWGVMLPTWQHLIDREQLKSSPRPLRNSKLSGNVLTCSGNFKKFMLK